MARDVSQRDIDMAGFRVFNLGPPQSAADATHVDQQTVPLPASGAGSPGQSVLAAPADHIHPMSAILQMEGDIDETASGPTEIVVFQRFVDFSGLHGDTIAPQFSAFISADNGDEGNFNLRLGGTAGAADGTILATISALSLALEPKLAAGPPVPRPSEPTFVKITAATGSPGSTARISDVRVTLTG